MHDPGPASVEAHLAQLPPDRIETTTKLVAMVRETLDNVDESVERGIVWWSRFRSRIIGVTCGPGYFGLIPTDAAQRMEFFPRLGRVRDGNGRILFDHLDDLDADAFCEMLQLHMRPQPLSPREQDVLRLMAAGMSVRGIGDEMKLGCRLVMVHEMRVLTKLLARIRDEAVRAGREQGYL